MWWVFVLQRRNSKVLRKPGMKWCIRFWTSHLMVLLYLLNHNRFLVFSLRESGKTNDALISDCGTLTKAQCKTNFKTAAKLCLLTTARELIAFGRRCRNNSACSPGGDSSGTSNWLILLFSPQNNTTSKHCLHLFTGAGRYNAGSHPEHSEWWNAPHFISDPRSWSWTQNMEETATDTTQRQHQDTAHVGRGGNGFQPRH